MDLERALRTTRLRRGAVEPFATVDRFDGRPLQGT